MTSLIQGSNDRLGCAKEPAHGSVALEDLRSLKICHCPPGSSYSSDKRSPHFHTPRPRIVKEEARGLFCKGSPASERRISPMASILTTTPLSQMTLRPFALKESALRTHPPRKPELQYFFSRPVVDQKALVQADESARSASKARADQKNARVVIKMSGCAPMAMASTGSSSGFSLNPKVEEPPVHLKMASEICWLMMDSVKKPGPAISARIPAVPARSPGKTALVLSHADTEKYSIRLNQFIGDFPLGVD